MSATAWVRGGFFKKQGDSGGEEVSQTRKVVTDEDGKAGADPTGPCRLCKGLPIPSARAGNANRGLRVGEAWERLACLTLSHWLLREGRTATEEGWTRGDDSATSTTLQARDSGGLSPAGHSEVVRPGWPSLGRILELTSPRIGHGRGSDTDTKDDDAKISGVSTQLVALTEMGVVGRMAP